MRRTSLNQLLALLLVLVLGVSSAIAAPNFYLRVTPTAGTQDEAYLLAITLDDGDASGVPDLSGNDDFAVSYMGPQTSIQILNGHVSRSITWNYRMQARRAGDLQTPSADLVVGGVRMHAESLHVRVEAAGAPTPTVAPNNAQLEGARLVQSVTPEKIYVGQQAVASIELQTAIDLIEPQLPDLTYDGFLTKVIADNERTSRIIQGVPHDVVRFRRAVYPLKAGQLTLSARTLKTKIRARSKRGFPFNGLNPFDMDADFFDRFFNGGSLKDVAINSNEVKLQVQDVPAWPDDAARWGLTQPIVGETTIEASLDKASLKTGDSATLVVKILSTGNLNTIKSLPPVAPATIKLYEEAPDNKEFESGGALMMQKILRASLVPTSGGDFVLPPIALTYFDPSEGAYRTIQGPQFTLHVEGAALAATVPTPIAATVTADKTSAPTLRYEEDSWTKRLSRSLSPTLALLIIFSLCFFAMAAWILLRILGKDAPAKNLLQRLSLASDLSEISILFKQYVQLKTGVDLSVRGEPLRASLEARGVNRSLAFAIERVLDQLDASLYSGARTSVDRVSIQQEALATAKEL